MSGEELSFGFDEVNELEEYIFVVDDYTNQKNRLKLLHFITNFQKSLEEEHNMLFRKVSIYQRSKDKILTNNSALDMDMSVLKRTKQR